LAAVVVVVACGSAQHPPVPATGAPPPALLQPEKPAAKKRTEVTAEQAAAFMERAERELLRLWIDKERAEWVRSTYITPDTAVIDARAAEAKMAAITRLAQEAVRYAGLDMPKQLARKFKLLKLTLDLPAPADAARRAELARLVTEMKGIYGKGQFCVSGASPIKGRHQKRGKQRCFHLGQLSKRLQKSRDYDELLAVWRGWRTVSRPMKQRFARYVALANAGARELGFADLGALWRSRFDLDPAAFEREIDRLWRQVKPLYQQLHCYARGRLQRRYGKRRVRDGKPIPAHLLGNMWAQDWAHVADLLSPRRGVSVDPGPMLRRRRVRPQQMVRFGERFFTSLGMASLPQTFWKRSMFVKPRDREVVCHASAWDIDADTDLRIKMCINPTGEDLTTIHHELGHIYYYYYYRQLSYLFRDSANKGFHEGLGDTIALSVTPRYLKQLGLIARVPKDDIAPLLARALDKVTFLPFGLLIDKWRWDVFAGKVKPAAYNAHWWRLRRRYQGVSAPVARAARDFDPGAKYHIAANVPYVRYFLAHVLQFQFHRALCRVAGHRGPLHRCSIFNNKRAGKRLMAMMRLGQSLPWQEALHALTGERAMDATALLEYFKPLQTWLERQNRGRKCGY